MSDTMRQRDDYTVFLGLCLAGITQWKAAKVVANA